MVGELNSTPQQLIHVYSRNRKLYFQHKPIRWFSVLEERINNYRNYTSRSNVFIELSRVWTKSNFVCSHIYFFEHILRACSFLLLDKILDITHRFPYDFSILTYAPTFSGIKMSKLIKNILIHIIQNVSTLLTLYFQISNPMTWLSDSGGEGGMKEVSVPPFSSNTSLQGSVWGEGQGRVRCEKLNFMWLMLL